MTRSRLFDHKIIYLKFYRHSSQQLKRLRTELGVPSAADVIHRLLERYELPDPRPQLVFPPAMELGTKEVYETDHKQLRLLKYALGFDSYADVVEELLRYHEGAPVPAPPAPPGEEGE